MKRGVGVSVMVGVGVSVMVGEGMRVTVDVTVAAPVMGMPGWAVWS